MEVGAVLMLVIVLVIVIVQQCGAMVERSSTRDWARFEGPAGLKAVHRQFHPRPLSGGVLFVGRLCETAVYAKRRLTQTPYNYRIYTPTASDTDAVNHHVCRGGILRQETWSFTNAVGEADRITMKTLTNGGQSYEQNN